MRRLLAFLLLIPGAAAAQPLRATYAVHAAGMVVLEVEARYELTPRSYRIETVLRTRGLAAAFFAAENATRVDGAWAGAAASPARYVSEGVWRGRARRTTLDWQGSAPRVLDLVPPNEEEREAVPEAQRRGTTDLLSAFAQIGRQVASEGRCALAAPLFDGRRRSDFATRDEGRERILPWRGAWHGEALRCGYEGRQVAGFRRDQDRSEAAEPQRGTVWIAAPFAGAPVVPVRIDIPTRWFGTATAVLLRAEPG